MINYVENLQMENLSALLFIVLILHLGKNKGLPLVIGLFYVSYMAIDFAFFGLGPDWYELTEIQEQVFNLICACLGLIAILGCGLVVQYESERVVEYVVPLPKGKKLKFRWYVKLVSACYAVILALFWVLPYLMQFLTISYTWKLHAAIMNNMIVLDIGCAWLAQLGRPLQVGLRDHG